MPYFPNKSPSKLESAVCGWLAVINIGIWSNRLTECPNLRYLMDSRVGWLTRTSITSRRESPVLSAVQTESVAPHSQLAFWKTLFILILLFAALGTMLACGDNSAGSSSELADAPETSPGISPSSTTRAVAAPATSTVPTDPTPSTGTAATGNAESQVSTPTAVPASTPGTSASTGQPAQVASSTRAPSEPSPEATKMAATLSDYGEFYLISERYLRAVQVLDRAIEIQPDFAMAYVLRGTAYAEMREFDEALDDLDKAISLDPSDALQAHLARSNVYTQLGEYDRAIQDGEAALSAVVQGINNRTIERREHSQQSRAAITAMAVAFFRAGNHSDYEDHARNILVGIEGYEKARIAIQSPFEEQHSKMQEINNRLILEPGRAGLYLERALVYSDIGWTEKAIEDYTKTFELWEQAGQQTGIRRQSRGLAYLQLGQYDRAVDDFRAYERQVRGTGKSYDPEIHASEVMRLAGLYLRARSVEEAVRVLGDYNHRPDDSVDRFETFLEYAVFMGFLHAVQGDFDTAEEYLNVYLCDATERRCTYPDEISVEKYRGTVSEEVIRSMLWGASRFVVAPLADEIDSVSVNRFLSRLYFHIQDFEHGRGRYHSLLASEVLIEQAPDLPEAYIANAVAHLGWVNLRARAVRDPETAQPMLDHYDQFAKAYAAFQSIAGPNDLSFGRSKLAEAYRVLALRHLRASGGPPEKDYSQENFELAGQAYENYSALTEPDREFEAEYAFSRGTVLASWERKEDAQAAYKEAFDLGYDRRAVEEALAALSNR